MARTDIATIDADVTAALAELRGLAPASDERADAAFVTVETFVAVALRVMAKTNPSKVRSEARNVEIQMRIPKTPTAATN